MMMAAAERCDVGPGSGAASPDYSMLVVVGMVGALRAGGRLEDLLLHIESGVRGWSVPMTPDVLDRQLKLFVSRHSAFASEELPGLRTLRYRGDVLDTQVVLNPGHDLLCSEVRQLLRRPSPYKLLVLAGQCVEGSGHLVLQRGLFSMADLLEICADEETPANLTLACPERGFRGEPPAEGPRLRDFPHVRVNPPPLLPQTEGLQEFSEYLSECLEPESPFDLLEPPSAAGFLKLSRPCCYVFPGGAGDCAFFAVNGFNVLVDGGSDPRACFWKLVRHLDRIDCVVVTHAGVDNLPGLNALLLRKLAERDSAPELPPRNLLSPEIGVVFFNVPEVAPEVAPSGAPGDPGLLRAADQGALMRESLRRLSVEPLPLRRPDGPSVRPLALYHKMGVGRLELYPLSPAEGGREPPEGSRRTTTTTTADDGSRLPPASVCALLVWHPCDAREKIVRVLFPGSAPQAQILEGLDRLKHLDFLAVPSVTSRDLLTSAEEKLGNPLEGGGGLRSGTPPPPPPPVPRALHKDRGGGALPVRKSQLKLKPRAAAAAAGLASASKEREEREDKSKALKPSDKLLFRKRDAVVNKEASENKKEKGPRGKKDIRREDGKSALAKDVKKVGGASSAQAKKHLLGNPKTDTWKKAHVEKNGRVPETSRPPTRDGARKNARATPTGEEIPPAGRDSFSEDLAVQGPAGPDPDGRERESPARVEDSLLSPSAGVTTDIPGRLGRPGKVEDLQTGSDARDPVGERASAPALNGHGVLADVSHDVDLCLVSPCEFRHGGVPAAESRPRPPSPDPPSTPVKDPLPSPPRPEACAADAPPGESQKAPVGKGRGRGHPAAGSQQRLSSGSDGKSRSLKSSAAATPERKASVRISSAGSRGGSAKPATASKAAAATAEAPPVHVDLAYLPSGPARSTVDSDLFRRLRASYYVLSGEDRVNAAAVRSILDALLDGKSAWPDAQVTLIPTLDSAAMHQWYRDTRERQTRLSVTVLGSNSTVAMQDESFPACKVEF
ncbi:microtubule-associated protein 1S [Stigmatopora argus]